jgi:hypothetical protein
MDEERFSFYEFEVQETFNKHYEITEKNVTINIPLVPFTQRKISR